MITQVYLLKQEDFHKWFSNFPEFGSKQLKQTAGNVLVVFDPQLKVMRFFNCDPEETVLHLIIEVPGGLASSLDLMKLISSHISKLLYSTGLCAEDDVTCYWEGLFLESTLKLGNLDILQTKLDEITSISKHEIIRVKIKPPL